jgi:endonuclease I
VGSDAFYPGDTHKGDVARIILYMVVMYDFLKITNNTTLLSGYIAYSADFAVMGDASFLLQWHQDDPVDDFEKHRNDVIYTYQNNRNPFIDHPEWFENIYNNSAIWTAKI